MMTVAIVPHHSDFGEYQRGLGTENRVRSLRAAALVYSDGETSEYVPVEELEGQADIRGLVHDEPEKMYAVPAADGYIYFGVA